MQQNKKGAVANTLLCSAIMSEFWKRKVSDPSMAYRTTATMQLHNDRAINKSHLIMITRVDTVEHTQQATLSLIRSL